MSRGFALPVALLTLVIVGAFVSALVFVAVISRRSGSALRELSYSQFTSETDAYLAASDLNIFDGMALPISPNTATVPRGGVARYGAAFWMVSAGADEAARGLHRTVGLLATARAPRLAFEQAFATPGEVTLGSGTSVDLWGAYVDEVCAGEASDTVGTGFSVPRYEDRALWSARKTIALVAGSMVTPVPAEAGSTCDLTSSANWGDPIDPIGVCRAHYPVVWAPGDLIVEGGVGQGVLVVDGDLVIRAGFRFHGLILVGGGLVVESGGSWIQGSVQVEDGDSVGTSLENAQISFSGCRLWEALGQFGEFSVLARKAWFQLY